MPLPNDLKDVELFTGLPADALAAVSARARIRNIAKGTVIFTQGKRADHCHVLLKGRVRITQSDGGGAQMLVRFIGPGETFGTVALFTDGRYPAEAITVIEAVEASWTETALRDLMARYPQIGANIIKVLGARIREIQERLRELATQRVERRIANAILRLADRAGARVKDGTAIEFPLTRRDVAELCGATLHTVSRVLTAWEKQKLLTTSRQRLTIRRPEAIRRMAMDVPAL